MSVQVSVVVPTFRRDDLLRACLERLLDQSLEPAQYEVIVCDDGPGESTRQLVESFQRNADPGLLYIPITATQGPAGARNRGWQAARGSIVAFTDDDCLPDRNWLSAGLAAMAEADAVTGRTFVPVPDRPTDYERDVAGLATAEFITANCFVRRSALQRVGGFDERFTSAWREDSDLHFSLLESGFRVIRAEQAVVVHPIRPAPWGVSIKQQRKGVFDPLLRRKHPEHFSQRIHPFPLLYVVIVAALALAIVGVLMRINELAILSFLMWLICTAAFAWQRLRGASRRPSHIAEMIVTSILIPPLSIYWRIVGLIRYGAPSFRSPQNRDAVGVTPTGRLL